MDREQDSGCDVEWVDEYSDPISQLHQRQSSLIIELSKLQEELQTAYADESAKAIQMVTDAKGEAATLRSSLDVQQQHEAKRARVGDVTLPTFMEMRDYIAEQLAPDTTEVTSLITVATTGWGVPVTDSADRIKSIKEIYLTLIRAHGRM